MADAFVESFACPRCGRLGGIHNRLKHIWVFVCLSCGLAFIGDTRRDLLTKIKQFKGGNRFGA